MTGAPASEKKASAMTITPVPNLIVARFSNPPPASPTITAAEFEYCHARARQLRADSAAMLWRWLRGLVQHPAPVAPSRPANDLACESDAAA